MSGTVRADGSNSARKSVTPIMTASAGPSLPQARFLETRHHGLAEKRQFVLVIDERERRAVETDVRELRKLGGNPVGRPDQRIAAGSGGEALLVLLECLVIVTVAEILLLPHVIIDRFLVDVLARIVIVVVLGLGLGRTAYDVTGREHHDVEAAFLLAH